MDERKEGPNRGNAGKGRPKGSPNKLTKALKEMILLALDEAHPEGAVEYLKQQAQTNPNAFLTLVGKVLPMTVAGDPENPVGVAIVERRIVRPAD
jgi:hypothetical protein